MTQRKNLGLYDASFEHDSCGFGMIANSDGRASRWLVDQAFSALAKMSHRGGINADGVTGDGCGILLYRPEAWLRALAREAGIEVGDLFAAGLMFLDRDADCALTQQRVLECCLREEGVRLRGWREVPVNETACGALGTATRPRIAQVFVDAGDGAD